MPGATWTPSFTIMDKAAVYWYHPHLHHFTNKHVSKGIAGMIIVKDSEEAALALPRDYGIDDFPLVIQTKDFDASNQIMIHTNNDETPMVNATIDPFLNVPSQVVRFRVLNGSSMRAFNLGLSDGATFYQIASDGGLLSSPFSTTRVLLAPGERAELLIDFSGMNGDSVSLNSFASELQNGIYGATNPGMGAGMTLNGYNPNPLNGADFELIEFKVGSQTTSPITSIPSTLATVTPIPEANATTTRNMLMQPVTMGPNQLNGDFLINGVAMDMSVINETVYLNDTEIWSLRNQSGMAHPFHIHDVQFYILDRNGVAPAANEQGRKDVVLVKPQETVRFITVFEDFADSIVPFMYHCHLLIHEDGGMMGQFIVIDTTKKAEPNLINELSTIDVIIYPNPTKNGDISIVLDETFGIDKIEIINTIGEIVYTKEINEFKEKYIFSDLNKGIYVLQLSSKEKRYVSKFIVE